MTMIKFLKGGTCILCLDAVFLGLSCSFRLPVPLRSNVLSIDLIGQEHAKGSALIQREAERDNSLGRNTPMQLCTLDPSVLESSRRVRAPRPCLGSMARGEAILPFDTLNLRCSMSQKSGAKVGI